MKTWVRKSLNVGVLSAGFLLVAGTAAHADSTGVGNGNTLDTDIDAPVTVSGNSISALGLAGAEGGKESATARSAATEGADVYNVGLLSGNVVKTVADAPVNVTGNAVGVAGNAAAASSAKESVHARGEHRMARAAATEDGGGNVGIGNGNVANTLVSVPVNVCGNAVGALGTAQASCGGGAAVSNGGG